jgi:hypothetical protein
MSLVKILENVGRGALGIILAGALTFCDDGTGLGKTEEIKEEPTPQVQTGDIQGKVSTPLVENNQIVWYGRDNAVIELDGVKREEKSKSNGLFYISEVSKGIHNLVGRYYSGGRSGGTLTHKSESLGVPVYANMLTTINVDIQLIPLQGEKIIYGTIYTDKNKTATFNGKVQKRYRSSAEFGSIQDETVVSNGVYAFQGLVDSKTLSAQVSTEPIIYKKIKIFSDGEVPYDYSLTNSDGVTEQNGYIVE